MQVQIKFTATGSSAITGNFAPGDVLRCAPEVARHLVEEAGCAKYTEATAGTQPPAKTARKRTTDRTKE
jgi:hypothetical protein